MAEKTRACALCGNKTRSMHFLPKREDIKQRWLEFIYGTSPPSSYNNRLVLCSTHFTDSDFRNYGEYYRGFASKLYLRSSSVPSKTSETSPQGTSFTSSLVHVGTQMDPPQRSSRVTQLSMGTLAPHFRSKGVQFDRVVINKKRKVDTSDAPWGSRSTTPIKSLYPRPSKIPHLKEEEEEAAIATVNITNNFSIPDPLDTTFEPDQSMTPRTESSQLSVTSVTSPVGHTDKKFIVFEENLMELFQQCPKCKRVAAVKMDRQGTFLSVEQNCHHCEFFRQWKSQSTVGSTAAGDV